MSAKDHIVIAILNWGLGHATRCMPLIDDYLANGKRITLAGDGEALLFLQKEYPELPTLELPSYDIRYSSGGGMVVRILAQIPKMNRRFKQELSVMDAYLERDPAELLISDSRFGLHTTKCPTVFITHQLFIKSPFFPHLVNRKNHRHISRFDEVWVPDFPGEENLSGSLGHGDTDFDVQYIGPLSRFSSGTSEKTISVLAILSGPEPQRGILEKRLAPILAQIPKSVMVRGCVDDSRREQHDECTVLGHLLSSELEEKIKASEVVVCRAGYSSIMDLSEIGSVPAILIPTPGQTEQEYLARHLDKRTDFRSALQKDIEGRLPSLLQHHFL